MRSDVFRNFPSVIFSELDGKFFLEQVDLMSKASGFIQISLSHEVHQSDIYNVDNCLS